MATEGELRRQWMEEHKKSYAETIKDPEFIKHLSLTIKGLPQNARTLPTGDFYHDGVLYPKGTVIPNPRLKFK